MGTVICKNYLHQVQTFGEKLTKLVADTKSSSSQNVILSVADEVCLNSAVHYLVLTAIEPQSDISWSVKDYFYFLFFVFARIPLVPLSKFTTFRFLFV